MALKNRFCAVKYTPSIAMPRDGLLQISQLSSLIEILYSPFLVGVKTTTECTPLAVTNKGKERVSTRMDYAFYI